MLCDCFSIDKMTLVMTFALSLQFSEMETQITTAMAPDMKVLKTEEAVWQNLLFGGQVLRVPGSRVTKVS